MNRAKTMKEKVVSDIITIVLNETYTYFKQTHNDSDLEIIKKKLLALARIESFEFIDCKVDSYSYKKIQETLSTLNEKESIRKNKGVYYTPADVVSFITVNSILAVYGKLSINTLNSNLSTEIPFRSFCFSKLILDPTCGAGEFLLDILERKFDVLDSHVKEVDEIEITKIVSTIFGNDINEESTTISKIRLFICAVTRYGLNKCTAIDDKLNCNFTNFDFVSSVPPLASDFDLIVGNPPYVEDAKSGLAPIKKYGNIYANVLRNSADLLRDKGALGFIIPLSYVSTPRMNTIREDLFTDITEQFIFSYSDRPDCLFNSVHQKLCILVGKKKKGLKRVFTGNYQYWYKNERDKLFDETSAVRNDFISEECIPKLGTLTDIEIYKKICKNANKIALAELQDIGEETVYINMRAAFWIKAFRKMHTGSEYKKFTFKNEGMANYFSCLVNSSLFWWYWVCVSDCWHITKKELNGFMVPLDYNQDITTELAKALENKLEETKIYVGTKQTEYEYKHRSCIANIHAIDEYINDLYGLTDSESLYIKNFAYRYRMSGGAK